MNYNVIKEKVIVKKTLEAELQKDVKTLEEKKKELKECMENIELHKLAYAQLEKIITDSNVQYLKTIENLLNKAVRMIFYDEEYSIKIVAEDKTLSFDLIDYGNLDSDNKPLQVDINDACGGGIITVIGFILQLFTIERLKLNKVIFIDEGFMALSEKYRPAFYDFINQFCDNTGMIIVLISHDELVKDKAVQVFEIQHGEVV